MHTSLQTSLELDELSTSATAPETVAAASLAASLARSNGMRLTLQGSFSAVSKPNFAREYALESSG